MNELGLSVKYPYVLGAVFVSDPVVHAALISLWCQRPYNKYHAAWLVLFSGVCGIFV